MTPPATGKPRPRLYYRLSARAERLPTWLLIPLVYVVVLSPVMVVGLFGLLVWLLERHHA